MGAVLQDNKVAISNFIALDLKRLGVDFIDGVIYYRGKNYNSVSEYADELKKEVTKNISQLRSIWQSVPIFLAEDSGIITSEGSRLLSHCLYNLLKKVNSYHVLSGIHASISIRSALNSDTKRWSDKTAEDISYLSVKIDNIERDIRNKAFIVSSIHFLHESMKKVAQSSGGSVQGAYSNLDLPMAERWYLWRDIDDEVDGRRDSIRSQRRYQMGLEDSDPLGVKEGFYWREIRNEPYKFDVLYPDSPYPYRSALWGNP